jgi:hypothetical protein
MKAEAAPLKADIQRFKTDLNKWILILKGVQTVIILGAVIALARMTHWGHRCPEPILRLPTRSSRRRVAEMLAATRRGSRPHATELLFRAEASVLEAEFELFQLRHAQ